MYKKLLLGIFVVIIILILYLVHNSLLESFSAVDDIKSNIKSGKNTMENNNSTNLLEQDRFIKCENRASPNQIADAYVDCCKSNSNQATCNHPVFKKCKDIYFNNAKNKTFINYLGNENTYNNEKNTFKKCIKSLYDALPQYRDQKYNNTSPKMNYYVERLYSLKNKPNLNLLCKDFCNIYKGECAGYQSDKDDCMLYKKIKPFNTINDIKLEGKKIEGIKGNTNLYIKA